jgi:hypothetical protein
LGGSAAGTSAGGQTVLTTGLLFLRDQVTPVVLVSFSASMVDGAAVLSWSLTEDSNPVGFHIERGALEQGPFERLTAQPLSGSARSYTDRTAGGGVVVWFRLIALGRDGREILLGILDLRIDDVVRSLALYQNAPNPVGSATVFRVDLPQPGPVRLRIFDVSGRPVATLLDGHVPAGRHLVPWDRGGQEVSGGVYFYRLEAAGRAISRKMVIIP